MKVKSVLASLVLLAGAQATPSLAQSGELIATATYVKPGCGWQLIATHTGGFGGGGPSGPLYEYHLKCGAEFVAFRLQSVTGTSPSGCYTSNYNQSIFTLSGDLCSSSFSVRRK